MLHLEKYHYVLQVGIVFNTQPRLGTDTNCVWVSRQREQDQFAKYFLAQGLHVLLDGPTGTGKTSLAITALATVRARYAKVVVADGMTWPQFCVNASTAAAPARARREREVLAGIEGGMPTLLYRATSSASSAESQQQAVQEWAATATEYDVARIMQAENIALMIDDAESASPELVLRLANLAKLLTTEVGGAAAAKLIVVGTGDICRRLYMAKPALEKRVGEVSLGTFPDRKESWDFLRRGFERLKRLHPGNSAIPAQKASLPRAIDAVYEAADGLPKALNDLGRDVALEAEYRDISVATLVEVANAKALQNWRQYKRECRDLFGCLQSNPITRDIVAYLYERGVGRIHDSEDIHGVLDQRSSDSQVEHALAELCAIGFLTRTGISNQVVFVQSPSLAHTLGVVLRDPKKYPGATDLLQRNDGQMWLLPPGE